jgi:3-dehydroquinate dehydratase-1
MCKYRINLSGKSPLVVGTIHNRGGLRLAKSISTKQLDLVEIRVDQLGHLPSPEVLSQIPVPKLFTVRHHAEGGATRWTRQEREVLYERALPCSQALDLELRSFHELRRIRQLANDSSIPVIASWHDFRRCPDFKTLKEKCDRARGEGATLFKAAVFLRSAKEIIPLLALLENAGGFPVAAMGMGPFGRSARLFLTAAGSRLIYGWLHQPQVPGQYPALDLKQRLAEALP